MIYMRSSDTNYLISCPGNGRAFRLRLLFQHAAETNIRDRLWDLSGLFFPPFHTVSSCFSLEFRAAAQGWVLLIASDASHRPASLWKKRISYYSPSLHFSFCSVFHFNIEAGVCQPVFRGKQAGSLLFFLHSDAWISLIRFSKTEALHVNFVCSCKYPFWFLQ